MPVHTLLAVAAAAFASATSQAQVVLYDHLGLDSVTDIANWDGGGAWFGFNRGAQAGQRVANPSNLDIHRIVGDWTASSFDIALLDGGARIQVFALTGDSVGPMLSETIDSGIAAEVFPWGLRIYSSVGLSLPADNGGGDILIVMQPASEHMWGDAITTHSGGPDNVFIRDFSSFGYTGAWGFTDWRSTGHELLSPSDLNMRVEAIPSPGSLVILALASCSPPRRRRKPSNQQEPATR